MHTFGKGGTDVVWSYLQFLRYHQDYDTVIFVATRSINHTHIQHGHDTKDITGEASMYDPNHIVKGYQLDERPVNCTVDDANKWLNRNNHKIAKESQKLMNIDMPVIHAFQTYLDYHEHVTPVFPDRDKLIWASILDNIIRIRPDVKMINATPDSYIENEFNIPSGKIQLLYKAENDIFDNGEAIFDQTLSFADASETMPHLALHSDARIGHLTTETHRILYKLMKPWLTDNNTWFDFDLEAIIKQLNTYNLDKKRYFVREHKNVLSWARYNNILRDIE